MQVALLGGSGHRQIRLVHALEAQVVDQQRPSLVRRCSPYHQHTMLYPVIASLQRALDVQSAVSGADHLATLEAFHAPFPRPSVGGRCWPVSIAACPRSALSTATRHTAASTRADARYVGDPGGGPGNPAAPLVFIVEDVHWADLSTLDFLERLLRQVPTTSLLVVLTAGRRLRHPGMNIRG